MFMMYFIHNVFTNTEVHLLVIYILWIRSTHGRWNIQKNRVLWESKWIHFK